MLIKSTRVAKTFLLAGTMGLTLFFGCSGNQNEEEFLKSAPPGKPSEFPNETVSQRRSRTRGPSISPKGAGAKQPQAGKKA